MSQTKVQKLARSFMTNYGPMTKASAKKYAGMFKEGKINIPDGYTKEELSSALELVNTISYLADTNAYKTGGTDSDPAKGKAILESQALRSPAIQQQISSMLPQDHEYSQAVSADLEATNKSEAMLRGTKNNMDMNAVQQQAMSSELNTSQQVSDQEAQRVPEGVSVSPSGKSLQYRGKLTGTGDARALKQHIRDSRD